MAEDRTVPSKTKSSSRKPRSTAKGDELGKNKVQKTINQYFSPNSAKLLTVVSPKSENQCRKRLFGDAVASAKATVRLDTIIVSDDEKPEVRSLEQYHTKTRSSSKRKMPPKIRKSKTSSSEIDSESFSSLELVIPSATESSGVLRTLAPNNSPSLLSRKSRKRKSFETTDTNTSDVQGHNRKMDSSVSKSDLNSPTKKPNFEPQILKGSVKRSKVANDTVAQDLAAVDDIDWSEPMPREEEILRSPKKSAPQTPTKLVPSPGTFNTPPKASSSTSASPLSKNSNSGSSGPSTSKFVVTPSKPLHLTGPATPSKTPQFGGATTKPVPLNIPTPLNLPPAVNQTANSSTNAGRSTGLVTPSKAHVLSDVTTNLVQTAGPSKLHSSTSSGPPNYPTSALVTPPKAHFSPGPVTPSKIPHHTTVPNAVPLSSPSKARTGPTTPSKSPKKFTSPQKINPDATSGKLVLEHCIQECKKYARPALELNRTNQGVASNYLSLSLTDRILLHQLLARKFSWIRVVDMKYDKVVQSLESSLDILQDKGFLEEIAADEPLEVILKELKRPELVELCKQHRLNVVGVKTQLVERLATLSSCQAGLGFSSKSLGTVLVGSALKLLGRCVRFSSASRSALRSIFEASVSPLYLEGQFHTFQERLRGVETLLNAVRFNEKQLIPFKLSDCQLFKTSAQFDEFISSVVLKFDMLASKERKDNAKCVELAEEAKALMLIYLHAEEETATGMSKSTLRYTAGSNYSSIMDVGIDCYKRAKLYSEAILAINILLQQAWYRRHNRGHWYAEKVLIMDKYLKRPVEEVYTVLSTGLSEALSPVGRLELSKKAEGILNKKRKGGLSQEQKDRLRQFMKKPSTDCSTREIRGSEAPNVMAGNRQTFVEYAPDGGCVYSNVEETSRNSYFEDFPEGVHDEGGFLRNIVLAAFWPVIYQNMPNAFVSQYQNAPLDWGSSAFYTNRQVEISEHSTHLRQHGVDGVVQQISDVIEAYSKYHSLIDWYRIAYDMLPTIKNIVTCLTVEKFLRLADYLLESYRERRSGWPDLTLWNTLTGRLKLVEVKSPNDELSLKQIVWLEKFVQLGIDVEVCRVNSTKKATRKRV